MFNDIQYIISYNKFKMTFTTKNVVPLISSKISVIIDFNIMNEIIGIECIDINAYTGNQIKFVNNTPLTTVESSYANYDDEVDILTIILRKENSVFQRSVEGDVYFDSIGCLHEISFTVPDALT